jgi:hypothetical protein
MKKTPLKRKTPLRAKPKEKSKFEATEVKVKKKVPNKWSKKKLVEKLDRIFSQYIRLKYSDSRGICQCISCMKRQPWNEIQNGHYMSRRYFSTRWSEDNCRPQCVGCNIFNQGNIQAYRVALIKQIGEQRVNLVEARARQETFKYGEFELNAMILHYTKEVERIAKEKGIDI